MKQSMRFLNIKVDGALNDSMAITGDLDISIRQLCISELRSGRIDTQKNDMQFCQYGTTRRSNQVKTSLKILGIS